MPRINQTISEFTINCFPGMTPTFYLPAAMIFFLLYIGIVLGNMTVITLICAKEQLHQPMYFLIVNLALSDFLFGTVTLPPIISKYWWISKTISYWGCFIQMFCVHFLDNVDSFLLLLMAIDRYVAICQPLRYHKIISNANILKLSTFFWVLSGIIPAVSASRAALLPYCRANKIENCFCALGSVASLACVDPSNVILLSIVVAMMVLFLPLTLIVSSYGIIVLTISQSATLDGWRNAFYTCTTHLLVICVFYVPRIFVCLSTLGKLLFNPDLRIFMILVYSLFPCLLNPVIYCLRTKEIKEALKHIFKVNKVNLSQSTTVQKSRNTLRRK